MKTAKLIGGLLMAIALGACTSTTVVPSSPPASGVSQAAGDPALKGTHWRLASATSGPLATLEHARTITMGFEDGRAFGNAGCNRYFGGYGVESGHLNLEKPATTMMYCEGDASTVERAFLDVLNGSLRLAVEDTGMWLITPAGLTLYFEPAPADTGDVGNEQ